VLDENGRKMSKSLGNVTSPQDVLKEYGADILRLWVIGSDYYDDLRIGKEILVRHADHYRRLRNTLRYLLGALSDFDKKETIDYSDMPEIEKWVLNEVYKLSKKIIQFTQNYQLGDIYREVYDFCNDDLSSFYFDIRKDTLYCDKKNSDKRQSCILILNTILDALLKWFAPILSFTTEEIFSLLNKDEKNSIHLKKFPEFPKSWKDDKLNDNWNKINKIRDIANISIEEKRAAKTIGSSLETAIDIRLTKDLYDLAKKYDFSEICITSLANTILDENAKDNIEVKTSKANGKKCSICWKIRETECERHPTCSFK